MQCYLTEIRRNKKLVSKRRERVRTSHLRSGAAAACFGTEPNVKMVISRELKEEHVPRIHAWTMLCECISIILLQVLCINRI